MMDTIEVNIKLFGAFRKFGEVIDLSIPAGSKVSDVKEALQKELNGEGLVNDSVLANDNQILCDSDVLNSDSDLSILPPVCGG